MRSSLPWASRFVQAQTGTTVPRWSQYSASVPSRNAAHSVATPLVPRFPARSFLAYEVLAVLEGGVTLDHLQSGVLIPLELEMAVHTEVAYWSPRQWLDTVDYAIRTQQVTLGL